MKTIEEIKNEVAVKHGYDSWVLLFAADRISLLGYVNEAMQLYAEQMCKRQRELCYGHSRLETFYDGDVQKDLVDEVRLHSGFSVDVNKESILTAPLANEE